MKTTLKIACMILSFFYVLFGLISLFNWVIGNFPLSNLNIIKIWIIDIPADLGYTLFMLTVGLLLIYGAFTKEILSISCLFIGSLLALSGMALQIIIAISNLIDAYIITLFGEQLAITLVNDLLRPEVVLGTACLPLLIISIQMIKEI